MSTRDDATSRSAQQALSKFQELESQVCLASLVYHATKVLRRSLVVCCTKQACVVVFVAATAAILFIIIQVYGKA